MKPETLKYPQGGPLEVEVDPNGEDERLKQLERDPTNAWGERVVAGEGSYPGPEALEDVDPEDTSTQGQMVEDISDDEAHELNHAHGGEYHNGEWPNRGR